MLTSGPDWCAPLKHHDMIGANATKSAVTSGAADAEHDAWMRCRERGCARVGGDTSKHEGGLSPPERSTFQATTVPLH